MEGEQSEYRTMVPIRVWIKKSGGCKGIFASCHKINGQDVCLPLIQKIQHVSFSTVPALSKQVEKPPLKYLSFSTVAFSLTLQCYPSLTVDLKHVNGYKLTKLRSQVKCFVWMSEQKILE